jgi:hypothetical protein
VAALVICSQIENLIVTSHTRNITIFKSISKLHTERGVKYMIMPYGTAMMVKKERIFSMNGRVSKVIPSPGSMWILGLSPVACCAEPA